MTKNKPAGRNVISRFCNAILGKWVSILIILACVGVVMALSAMPDKEKQKAEKVKKIVYVTVQKIVPQKSIWDSYEITGDVEENLVLPVKAEISGRIVTFAAKGDEITNRIRFLFTSSAQN